MTAKEKPTLTTWVVKLADGSVLEVDAATCRMQGGFLVFAGSSKQPEDLAIRADLVDAYGRKESLEAARLDDAGRGGFGAD